MSDSTGLPDTDAVARARAALGLDDLVSIPVFAAAAGVSVRTVERLAKQGKLRLRRWGKKRGVDRA